MKKSVENSAADKRDDRAEARKMATATKAKAVGGKPKKKGKKK